MNITLIQPRVGTSGVKGSMPPLAMGILAKFTPKDIALQFIEDGLEEIPDDLKTDLVALSVTTLTAKRAYEIADNYRSKGIKVVMGGIHPTLLPEETLQHADAIVIGVGELVWSELLQDAKNNKLQRVYTGKNDGPLNGLTPDRSIYKNKKYSPIVPIQFGRGCPFSCDFCSVHSFYGNVINHRPVNEVLEEVSLLKNKLLFFVDDNIYAYGAGAIELLRGLSKMNVRWIGQASVNVASKPETVQLLKESGCVGLIIGFESMSEQSLDQMQKTVNTKNDYQKTVNLLKKNRIMIAGSFIFGYDADTPSSIINALDFSEKNNFVHAYFNPLVPTPSTALYDRILKEGRFIEPTWWLSNNFRYGQIPYKTKGMTNKELEVTCIKARLQFDSFKSIFKRAFSSSANCFPLKTLFFFLLANFVYRKEYKRKYGKILFETIEK